MTVIKEDVATETPTTAEHERLISTVLRELPEWIEPDAKAEIELLLVEHARQLDEAEFVQLASRVRAVLHR